MRRLLRNFPDKGSNLKIEEIKAEIVEIKKQTLQEVKTEPMAIFESKQEPKAQEEFDGTKLLGELLGSLRVNRKMATLMVCRQISKLEKEGSVVVIYPSGEDEISDSEQVCLELKQFFDSKGLSYRVYKEEQKRDPVQELNEMLGGKLKIE